MYTKEEFCKDVEKDMQELDLSRPRILHNYCFSESKNKIVLHFAVVYQKEEIEKLKLKYSQKYGEQFCCLPVKKNGTLNEVTFEFGY